MKYIYYYIVIVLIITVFAGYNLLTNDTTKENPALIINDKILTIDEFNKLQSKMSHNLNKDTFIDSLITKELMIQEAKREGIDKKESFRWSIQNFYEQSLIKILIEKRLDSLNIDIGSNEIEKYKEMYNKEVDFSVFRFENINEVKRGVKKEEEKMTIPFKNLSNDMRGIMLDLEEGRLSEPVYTGDIYIVYRMDKIKDLPEEEMEKISTKDIKRLIIEERKDKLLNKWISDIRKKANIEILVEK